MRFKIFCVVILSIIITQLAYADQGLRLDHKCTLFVEPGDSYIRLFGPDWFKVYQANSNMTFYDKQGKLTHSPEKLVTGTMLTVPQGTHLTARAMERLSKYQRIKDAAMKTMQQAEAFATREPENRSEVYQQGLLLLAKAKQTAKGLTFGFGNYLEANRLAQEAIRCFKIDTNLQKASSDMQQLKDQVEKEQVETSNKIKTLYHQRVFPLSLGVLLLFSLLWFMRFKNKKNRTLRVKAWLDQHQQRLEKLERAMT